MLLIISAMAAYSWSRRKRSVSKVPYRHAIATLPKVLNFLHIITKILGFLKLYSLLPFSILTMYYTYATVSYSVSWYVVWISNSKLEWQETQDWKRKYTQKYEVYLGGKCLEKKREIGKFYNLFCWIKTWFYSLSRLNGEIVSELL
jgi:hypothetical protein